jgi:hypothetical protein
MDPTSPVRYFAFGSNLWQQQMSLRCPSSPLIGIGRLRGYRWHINARGYANIAPTAPLIPSSNPNPNLSSNPPKTTPTTTNSDHDYANEVWGLIYNLNPADEAQLDLNEGVPYAYEKQTIPVEFWPKHSINAATTTTTTLGNGPDRKSDAQKVEMLVYIDHKRNQGGHAPRAEYVHRMNMGIRDALREGVPRGYVEGVLRGYIPAPGAGGDEGEDVGFALEQARGFRDESGVIPVGAGVVGGVGAAADAAGSGVVSEREAGQEEEEELPERASEVCYLKDYA